MELAMLDKQELINFHKNTYTEELCVDCSETEWTFNRPGTGFGFDNFFDILLPQLRPVWQKLKELDTFRWIRCHGIFRHNETELANWQAFEDQRKCIDTILDAGIKPIIELSIIPDAFADKDHPLGFGGNVQGWSAFVNKFVHFLIRNYGQDEVASWYFEFWNEPDHHFWAGYKPLHGYRRSMQNCIDDYCLMYDWTVKGVKDACDQLKVGGPAMAGNTIFLREFIKHCYHGTNFANGSNSSPLDFISIHLYSNSPDRAPNMANSLSRLLEIKNLVTRYCPLDIPMLLTEWGITWGGAKDSQTFPVTYRNDLHAAAFTLKFIKELLHLHFDVLIYWGFSEWTWETQPASRVDFNGQRTLFNYSGTERPVMGAYRLLKELRGDICHVHRMVDTNNIDALSTVMDGTLRVLFWHHDPDPANNALPSTTEIKVINLPDDLNSAHVRLVGYTRAHNTYAAWRQLQHYSSTDKGDIDIQDYGIPLLLSDRYIPVQDGLCSCGKMQIYPGECFLLTVSRA
ncbi:MAG: hypothetical protein PHT33_05265 [bacterium]|nr:hypothetical protein [bacterium]